MFLIFLRNPVRNGQRPGTGPWPEGQGTHAEINNCLYFWWFHFHLSIKGYFVLSWWRKSGCWKIVGPAHFSKFDSCFVTLNLESVLLYLQNSCAYFFFLLISFSSIMEMWHSRSRFEVAAEENCKGKSWRFVANIGWLMLAIFN